MRIVYFLLFIIVVSCSKYEDNIIDKEINLISYPEFSWERIPVCIHLYKETDFNEKDVAFISRFPIICIEKAHNRSNGKGLEYNTSKAASVLLNYNPKQKILFYWNSVVDYGEMYGVGECFVGFVNVNNSKLLRKEGLYPEWALKDKNGNFVSHTQAERCQFDISLNEVRDWWISVPKSVLSDKGVNGVFVDKVLSYTINTNKLNLGEEKYDNLLAAYKNVMLKLREQSPDNTLLITNSLRGNSSQQSDWGRIHLEYSDGGMIEHFADLSGKDKNNIANDIKLIQECAERGKVVIVKGWPRFNFTDMSEYKNKSPAELEEMAKQDIVFPLAAFLVAAGKYAYFCYSWGYEYSEGGMVDYPEYSNKLGEPLGLAEKNGYVYTREFEHASVWVDIEKREGKITWK